MKNELRNVGELTCLELFRLIARQLWGTYDTGGISVGRSYQSSLLEAFIDLFSCHSELVEGNMLHEVGHRYRTIYNCLSFDKQFYTEQPFLPFEDLCILNNLEFTFICLREMDRWYEEEAEGAGFFNTFHKNLAKAMFLAFRMYIQDMSLDALRSIKFSKESITRYAESRNSTRTNEDRLRDFEDMGINSWNDIRF